MYYVEVESQKEPYSVWDTDGSDLKSVDVLTTKLVGPFKYRKDVEDYMTGNNVIRVIQID